MGLISTEVEIGIGSANYKHYENLGYNIPKYYNKNKKKMCIQRGAKIFVKVEHLLKSAVTVEIECDCCGKIIKTTYESYLDHLHDDKYYCLQCASKIFNGGENSYKWNPNLTDEDRRKERHKSTEGYYEFLSIVKKRDNYKCIKCGSNINLNVHHLNGYNWDKNNRTNPNNAVTLCEDCHGDFHSIYGRGENTKEQFEEWFGLLDEEQLNNVSLSNLKKVVLLNNNKIYNTAKDASLDLDVDVKRIYDVCNHSLYSVNDLHFMYLEEYENTPKDELKNAHTYQGYNSYGKGNKVKVTCTTTGETFNSMSEAYEKYNLGINKGQMSLCCNGKRKYFGQLYDGTKLKWEYTKTTS